MENYHESAAVLVSESVSHPSTELLLKGVLKQELSDIQVTPFLAVYNFRNFEAMKLIFFFKMT